MLLCKIESTFQSSHKSIFVIVAIVTSPLDSRPTSRVCSHITRNQQNPLIFWQNNHCIAASGLLKSARKRPAAGGREQDSPYSGLENQTNQTVSIVVITQILQVKKPGASADAQAGLPDPTSEGRQEPGSSLSEGPQARCRQPACVSLSVTTGALTHRPNYRNPLPALKPFWDPQNTDAGFRLRRRAAWWDPFF